MGHYYNKQFHCDISGFAKHTDLFNEILTMLRLCDVAHHTFNFTTSLLVFQLWNSTRNPVLFPTANHYFGTISNKLPSNSKSYPEVEIQMLILS